MLERILLWLPSASSVGLIPGRIESSAAAQPPVFGLAGMAAAQEGTRSTAAPSNGGSLEKRSSSAADAPADGGSGGGPFGMKTGAAARILHVHDPVCCPPRSFKKWDYIDHTWLRYLNCSQLHDRAAHLFPTHLYL